MGVSVKVGAFNTGTGAVNSTQDITCGFQPKAIIFWWSGHTSSTDSCTGGDSKWGMGFATQTERCLTTSTDDNGAASQGSSYGAREDACIGSLTTDTVTWDGLVDIDAFANWPSDGFRLIIDDVMPLDMRVGFIAYGGSDITDVDLHRFNMSTGTGEFDVTITGGFQPDIVFFLSSQGAVDPPLTNDNLSLFSFGVGRTGSERAILMGGSDDGSSSSDTASYCTDSGDVAVVPSVTDPQTLVNRASFVQMNSNGFRLNQAVATASAVRVFSLCIKGGVWKVAPLTTQTDTSTGISISGLGATPKGVLVASRSASENSAGTPTAVWQTSLGAATSTTERHAQNMTSGFGDANMRVVRAVEHDACYVHVAEPGADIADGASGTINGLMDVQSVDSDGFTFIMDDADPSGSFAWAVMVGEIPSASLPIDTVDYNLTAGRVPAPKRPIPVNYLSQTFNGTLAALAPTILDAGTNTVTITAPTTTVSAEVDVAGGAQTVTITAPEETLLAEINLAAGENTVTITAPEETLVAGNSDVAAGTQTVTITAPDALLEQEAAVQYYQRQAVLLRGKAPSTADVLTIAQNLLQGTLKPGDATLAAGENTVTITAPEETLSAGNVDLAAGTQTVTITAPEETLLAETDLAAGTQTVTITAPEETLLAETSVAAGNQTVTVTAPDAELIAEGEPPFRQLDWKLPLRKGYNLHITVSSRPSEEPDAADPISNPPIPNPQRKKRPTIYHTSWYTPEVYDPFRPFMPQNPRRSWAKALDWSFSRVPEAIGDGQTLDAGTQTVTITAPTVTVASEVAISAGELTVTVTAPTVVTLAEISLAAGNQLVTITAPDTTLSPGESLVAAGTQTVTLTAPTSVIVSEMELAGGIQAVVFSAPDVTTIGGPTTVAANTNTVNFTAPTAFAVPDGQAPAENTRWRYRYRYGNY